MPFYTYILTCADGTFYIGSTNNIEKRLKAHNEHKHGARYTKMRRPVTLTYVEEHDTFREARQREAQLKKLSRKEKEALIKDL